MPIVTVPASLDSRKKCWRKQINEVDVTKSNGYAFKGPWLPNPGEKAELPSGALILCYDEPGSMKNWYPLVRVGLVTADGLIDFLLNYEGKTNERTWALSIRDSVSALVAEHCHSPKEPGCLDSADTLLPKLVEALQASRNGDTDSWAPRDIDKLLERARRFCLNGGL